MGNIGFYSSFHYFPIEIIAGAMLLEPFFAQIAAVVLGQDNIPGIFTLFGLILISVGFIVSGLGAKYKTEQSELQTKIKKSLMRLECSSEQSP